MERDAVSHILEINGKLEELLTDKFGLIDSFPEPESFSSSSHTQDCSNWLGSTITVAHVHTSPWRSTRTSRMGTNACAPR